MSRFLLLEVEDDDKAVALAKKLKPVGGVEIRGIYQRPTEFCERTGGVIKSAQGSTYREPLVTVRPKTGWRVCVICKKAVPEGQHLKNLLASKGETSFWLDLHWLLPRAETAFNRESALWARQRQTYGSGMDPGRAELKRARRADRKARQRRK